MSNPVDVMAAAFQDELEKIAAYKQKVANSAPKGGRGKVLAPMVAGAGLFELGRRANNDRKMGRAMRLQSQQ